MDYKKYLSKFNDLEKWLSDHKISEVECVIADMAGVARGKIVPTDKFISSVRKKMLRLPESIFQQSVAGDVVTSQIVSSAEKDMILVPDTNSRRIVPWYSDPTSIIICDAFTTDFEPISISPRQVLCNVIALYKKAGLKAVLAPELEFYLVKKNIDPDYPLEPPIGQNGRPETARQPYGIDAVNEFDPLFEDMYTYCEQQRIEVDTLIHEAGSAQVEINFNHGDPLELADQVFLFKRTVRQTALKHGIYATFMAKPHQYEPGSAMHIHQSIVDPQNNRNLFSHPDGTNTSLFENFIAGLQKYLPCAMPLITPNVNSYRRLIRDWAAPVNTQWGPENRTVGFRVPDSGLEDRRIENRIPGADANPYLAFAATMACGYLGIEEKLPPTAQVKTNESAYNKTSGDLPRHLLDALKKFEKCKKLQDVLGKDFMHLYLEVKNVEYDHYQSVISAWEREHLLLNV